jgi:hypothetical protein
LMFEGVGLDGLPIRTNDVVPRGVATEICFHFEGLLLS